jgi:GNAT superfamily N-acetyltransferase
MKPTLSVRTAAAEDAGAIAEVHVAAWRAAYTGIMPQPYLDGLSVERRAASWQRTLATPNPGTVLVVETAERVVGFCVYGPSRDADAPRGSTGELAAINLHPAFWRRGLGALLCEHVLADAAKREWAAMTLWVIGENSPARRFYERLGFAPDGGEKQDASVTGAPLHEVRYRKALK